MYGACIEGPPQGTELRGRTFLGIRAHKIGGTSGVDINTPPKIEYFKFFHTQDGSSAPVLRRGGARHYSKPPTSMHRDAAPPVMPAVPPIHINFPADIFQHLQVSHHSRPKWGRSPSPSDCVASPDDNAPVDDSPTPTTIREWITHLEMQHLAYKRWDFLRQKFAEEESMDMLISSLARLLLVNLKVGYSLKMVDAVFILEQLEVAGKRYGFAVGAQDDDRQRSKKARY
ncbi:hypothetical protein JB92DRAFT_3142063 [Gautieria morchelliformis]|nr:hypothetical protein JB92DRAFT_3142063 [Gautieria morchelliformis]